MRNRLLAFVVIALGLAFPGAVGALVLNKKTMDQMVAESDLIMIGRVESLSVAPPYGDGIAQIRGVAAVKGLADVTLVYRTGMTELNPDCCEIGKSYLFFLRRQPGGEYFTVGGRQGAIEAKP